MSLKKRFTGDFTIESIDSGSKIKSAADGSILIGNATAVIPILDGVDGGRYKITTVGTTDFTLIGSDDNVLGTVFTMNAVPPLGTGTVTLVTVLTVGGDLTVLGTATTINSIDAEIVDNTIVLNSGELGPGVSLGASGLEIDRGSLPAAGIQFNEVVDEWEVNVGSGWAPIVTGSGGIGNIVEDLTPQLGGPLDVNGQVITSNTGGDVAITPDLNGDVLITASGTGDVIVSSAANISMIASTTALVSATDTLTLSSLAGGIAITSVTNIPITSSIGDIVLLAALGVVKIEQEVTLKEMTPPAPEAGYNKVYADTAGSGGTGLFVVSDTVTDELVSRNVAIRYSLIF